MAHRKEFISLLFRECQVELEKIETLQQRAVGGSELDEILANAVQRLNASIASGRNEDVVELTETEISEVRFKLGTRQQGVKPREREIVLSSGEADRAQPWIYQKNVSWSRWENYREMLLTEGKSPEVISRHEIVIKEALEKTGDPLSHVARPPRKGLVMGNVQAGKTMNFVGLINMALDAGYHTVIVLGGHMNELRKQSQARVEQGAIDAHVELTAKHVIEPNANILTTDFDDFTAQVARQRASLLDQVPHLYVVKKLPRLLDRLQEWFAEENRAGVLAKPMLLIDDEADYASINTQAANNRVSRTNESIRALLNLFSISTYIAYTATPFANVFIPLYDESEASDVEGDELFPADFMIKMHLPEDYSGQEFFFSEPLEEGAISAGPCRILNKREHEAWLLLKHKIDANPVGLYAELKEAILVFVCVIAVRHYRGRVNAHNTMLVNVSRFNSVQSTVAANIDEYLKEIRAELLAFAALGERNAALQSEIIRNMRAVFSAELADSGVSFATVLAFYAATADSRFIDVQVVNGARRGGPNAPAALDYGSDANKANGLWVIAVGGLKLSRGLTLEDLSVSYFFRNALAYDTLTQMCRWFGYRSGFEDLCRLYLLEESYEHYHDVAGAINGLYQDLKMMSVSNGTPRDFGLKVKNSETALTITAKNKMGTARPFYFRYRLWGESVDALRVSLSNEVNGENFRCLEGFISTIKGDDDGDTRSLLGGSHVFSDVSYRSLGDFVKSLELPLSGTRTPSIEPVLAALEALDRAGFAKPQVVLFSRLGGSSYPGADKIQTLDGSVAPGIAQTEIAELPVTLITKRLREKSDQGLAYSASKLISDSDDLSVLFSPEELSLLDDQKPFTNQQLRQSLLTRPVIIIYAFRALVGAADALRVLHSNPSVAYSLHFPSQPRGLSIPEMDQNVQYLANEVLRNIEADEMRDEDEEEITGA